MKILQLTTWYYPLLGGVEHHVQRISEELASLGCDVKIFTLTDTQEGRARSFHHLRVPRIPEWMALAPSPALFREVLKSDANIVHAHSYGYPLAWAAALARKLRKTRFVFTPHSDPYSKIHPAYDLTRAIPAKASDRLIANTSYEAQHLRKIGMDPLKIRVIPNGLEVGSAGSRPIPGPYILCLGRVVFRQKGQDILLRAYKESKFSQKLVFVGAGPDLPNLKQLAGDPNVLFLGALYGDQKWRWLGNADLVVVPSRTESYGQVALEAAAMRRRLVVTRVGGLQHIAGPFAVLADPNPASLAKSMHEALEAEPLVSPIDLGAYSWKRVAQDTLAVYQELIAS